MTPHDAGANTHVCLIASADRGIACPSTVALGAGGSQRPGYSSRHLNSIVVFKPTLRHEAPPEGVSIFIRYAPQLRRGMLICMVCIYNYYVRCAPKVTSRIRRPRANRLTSWNV